jgi:hypothetical protein
MSLNESIVEDAALEWFLLRSAALNYGGQVRELGYEVSVKGCGWLRTIRRLISPRTLATLRDMLLPKQLGEELSTTESNL